MTPGHAGQGGLQLCAADLCAAVRPGPAQGRVRGQELQVDLEAAGECARPGHPPHQPARSDSEEAGVRRPEVLVESAPDRRVEV